MSDPEGPFGRRSGPPPSWEIPEPAVGDRGPGGEIPPPPRPPGGAASTVTWMLGVLVIAAMAYIGLNSLRTEGPGSRGLEAGRVMPAFAAPLVTGPAPDADANVAQDDSGGAAGSRPACEVRGEGIFNLCELDERGPVVLAFVVTKSPRCQDQVDVIEKVKARFPSVGFAAVAVRGSRGSLRGIVRKRGWTLPVAWDRDGAVANAYAVAVCPTVTFAKTGGQVTRTSLGFLNEADLTAAIEEAMAE